MNEEKNKNFKIIGIIIGIIILIVGGFFAYKYIDNSKTKPEEKNERIKEEITPLLYEVTKEGSNNKMYLFGSIHAADLNSVEFPKYLLDAYNNSHYIACEFNMVEYLADEDKMIQDTMNMLYSDGTTIKDHLSNETYTKLVELLTKKGLYSELYDAYKPSLFQSLLSNAMISDTKLNATQGIDMHFLTEATKDNKKILEVESSDFQMNVLTNLSDTLNEIIIKDALDNYDESVQSIINLYEAWKKGDEEALLKEADDEIDISSKYTEEEIKEIENYNKTLVDDRNVSMTKKAIEYFNNDQDVFFMVGALHIIGDKGIANSLKEQGYIVKKVTN